MAGIAWIESLEGFERHPTKSTVKEHKGLVLRDNLNEHDASYYVYWMNKCNKHPGIYVAIYA